MKKIFILIIVLCLFTSIAFADTISIIGKQVQNTFPLFIDGKKCDRDVIVIDGVSYLPVRDVAELIGFNVDFKDNQVLLTSKNDNKKLTNTSEVSTEMIEEKKEEIKWENLIVSLYGGKEDEKDCCIINGEYYVPINTFGFERLNYGPDTDKVIITLQSGEKFVFYRNNIDNYKVKQLLGGTYINVNALGLKVTRTGNKLIIE